MTVVLPRNSVLQIPHRLLCGFTMQLHARPEQTHFGPAAFSLVLSHVVHVWGVPTEELREVLKRELQDPALRWQLFNDRRIIEWHRVAAFQMISLLQIAEDMLLASPAYTKTSKLPLTFPGILLDKDFTFPTPVVLYVSRHNAGAGEVAEQVRSSSSSSSPHHHL